MSARRFIEVSHAIVPGMKTYPGLPEPRAEVILDRETSRAHYDGRAEFLIAGLHLCGNTGTYVDSPHHRYRDGADLADLPLDQLADLPVTLIDATAAGSRALGPDLLAGRAIEGRAVLFHTGFSRHFGGERYFHDHPFLTAETAAVLARSGAAFVGIDSLNIDDTADLARPVHSTLLGAGVPVCEHMANLAALPDAGGALHAVPIAWRGGTTFPVRAYVIAR